MYFLHFRYSQYKNEVLGEAKEWLEEMIDSGEIKRGEIQNEVRKFCYRTFTRLHYGYLGGGVRIALPTCVVDGIHDAHEDPNGNYMGHKDE